MTCKSCDYHRLEDCAEGESHWPNGGPVVCSKFCYLPGSDEAEDEVSAV